MSLREKLLEDLEIFRKNCISKMQELIKARIEIERREKILQDDLAEEEILRDQLTFKETSKGDIDAT